MQSIGGEAAGHSLVHDDHAWACANFPSASVVYPVHRLLVHQKKRVTVLLNAGLQPIGRGYGPVAATRLAVHEKDSLAPLSAKDEASFDYIWENKNSDCSRFT